MPVYLSFLYNSPRTMNATNILFGVTEILHKSVAHSSRDQETRMRGDQLVSPRQSTTDRSF